MAERHQFCGAKPAPTPEERKAFETKAMVIKMADILNKHYLESNGGDMTSAIQEKLDATGACILGSGTYFVSGINMPDGSSLMGMGKSTRIILKEDVTDGAAVKIGAFCTVKNLCIAGSENNISMPTEVGTRHGILFLGNATQENWGNQPRNSIIEGCFISSFTGGGLTCTDTGYYVCAALTVSNCHILNCGAAINISHFSEYHEFTNVLCSESLYGCINNGGNNNFTNCGFSGNVTAYVIDNSKGQSNNNSHGSVVGCSFNHSDNNKGIGILIMGATNGYIFSGCQMFYSKIVIENSTNIMFTGFNFGRDMDISVKGGKTVLFSDNVFAKVPTVKIEDNDKVRFINCFTRDFEEINI